MQALTLETVSSDEDTQPGGRGKSSSMAWKVSLRMRT